MLGGSQEVSYAVVANRTTKGSIGRISVLFTEIKAPSGRGELRLCTLKQALSAFHSIILLECPANDLWPF